MRAPFIDDFGMINSRPDESNAESSLLWTVENFYLNRPQTSQETIREAIELCRIQEGLFLQNPAKTLEGRDRFMSHDQLTAIMCFSYSQGYTFHSEIWEEIKNQWLTYNNLKSEGNSEIRLLHPRDLIFYAYLNGNVFGYLLLPILFIIMLCSSINTYKDSAHTIIATDGKLLNWVRCQAVMQDSVIWRVFYKIMTTIISKKFKNGWEGVFNTYFYFPGHPNRFE